MPLCALTHVSKTYGSGPSMSYALQNIDLTFDRGEFTVLSGPSGSGKTTLLNLVGCLDTPSAGQVAIDGVDIASLKDTALARLRSKTIGFIFQSFNLVPVLTAAENVETALQLAGWEGDREKAVKEILAAVGLKDFLHRRPDQLSGGQQQRVAVARALVKRPALVIADEPTANLDSKSGAQILDIMRQMNEDWGVTFLFSTHDPSVMARARRVVYLHDGQVINDEQREAPVAPRGA